MKIVKTALLSVFIVTLYLCTSCSGDTDLVIVAQKDINKENFTGLKIQKVQDADYSDIQDLDLKNTIDYTISVEETGYYSVSFFNGTFNRSAINAQSQLYLRKNDEISVKSDQQICTVKAGNKDVTTYMNKWSKQYVQMYSCIYGYASTDEKMQSVMTYAREVDQLFASESSLSPDFRAMHAKKIKTDKQCAFLAVKYSPRRVGEKRKEPADELEAFVNKSELDDVDLLKIPDGLNALKLNFTNYMVSLPMSGDKPKFDSIVPCYYTTPQIKNLFVLSNIVNARSCGSVVRNLIDHIQPLLVHQRHKDALNTFIEKYASLKPGTPAYDFECETLEGKKVKLSQLKGKAVFIDCWSTWCGPCKSEIPYLKKLEKELHGKDIVFMSVSIDKDKKKWKEFAKKEKLSGLVTWIPGAFQSAIAKQYKIKGIPRFIVIDKNGNIVDADAVRPSNPKLKELLLSL